MGTAGRPDADDGHWKFLDCSAVVLKQVANDFTIHT